MRAGAEQSVGSISSDSTEESRESQRWRWLYSSDVRADTVDALDTDAVAMLSVRRREDIAQPVSRAALTFDRSLNVLLGLLTSDFVESKDGGRSAKYEGASSLRFMYGVMGHVSGLTGWTSTIIASKSTNVGEVTVL